MVLKSRIFQGDPAFEACLTRDSAHITPGSTGDHVAKIQAVVIFLDNAVIVDGELKSKHYGPSTAAAVLNFKKKRKIINPAYQSQADNIVGKMTIQALDDELESRQVPTDAQPSLPCLINTPSKPDFLAGRVSSR